MIIVLITDTFHTNNNGTTISAMCLAEALHQRGHIVRVVTYGNEDSDGKDTRSGYDMYYLPENRIFLATRFAHKQHTLFAKPRRKTLERAITGADIVHVYQPWALGRMAQKIAKEQGVPAIAAFHIQPENITYNIGLGWFPPASLIVYYLLYASCYRKFKHIHCPSKFIAAQLRRHGYKAWLHVISNGIHPDFYENRKSFEESKKTRDIVPKIIKILMVGRLSPEKRQDLIIKAVGKSKYLDRIQIYFAGFGPREKRLKNLGKHLPHPPIFGYYNRKELIRLIENCDLYVHASDVEIEGIACMEAFTRGLVPVISDSLCSATGQFALTAENIFKAGDPNSLSGRIDAWLDNSKKRAHYSEIYKDFAEEFTLENSVKKMEHVYRTLPLRKSGYAREGFLYRGFSRLFHALFAVPLLYLFTRIVLGVHTYGRKNLHGIRGAVTVCNHVHPLDSTLVALALFPRKMIISAHPSNVRTLWPGRLVSLLGGVAIPENIMELKDFLCEMELALLGGRVVHFFPEGEMKTYDTKLRGFRKGAFYLAAQARTPLVPMSIAYSKPRGIRCFFNRKPIMNLFIGEPIEPALFDSKKDTEIRMEMVFDRMNALIVENMKDLAAKKYKE
jgi:1,2-diacylglycerol 3-alpha-glucosyltransferase